MHRANQDPSQTERGRSNHYARTAGVDRASPCQIGPVLGKERFMTVLAEEF